MHYERHGQCRYGEYGDLFTVHPVHADACCLQQRLLRQERHRRAIYAGRIRRDALLH